MTHPNNSRVRRGPNGVWNEDTLPVTDWENPAHRIVLPRSLLDYLGTPLAMVLRWDAEKREAVMMGHHRDRHVIVQLDRYLADWTYVGREAKSGRLRVLFTDEDGRWYQVSIGELLGSWNVITVFGSSADGFLRKRLTGLIDVRTSDGDYLNEWKER